MIAKGYNMETLKHHDKLLNEYTSEYGLNLNHKENSDIFKINMKPKNNGNLRTKDRKK